MKPQDLMTGSDIAAEGNNKERQKDGYEAFPHDNAPNSAIRYPVTIGGNIARPNQIQTCDISYVIECIKRGQLEQWDIRALILTIRNLPNPDLAGGMKRTLPYFLGSLCDGRRANSAVRLAHFMIFDLDHVEAIEQVKEQAAKELRFIRYAFRSVRDGVKLIAGFKTPIINEDVYRQLWAYLALQIEKALGHKVDATPDWSRACFLSYDPKLLYNNFFQPLELKPALEEAEFVAALRAKSKEQRAESKDGCAYVNPASEAGLQPSALSPVQDKRSTVTLPNCPPEPDFEMARRIVAAMSAIRVHYSDWIKVGFALYRSFGERGKELWDMFLDNPYYKDSQRKIDHKWESFRQAHSVNFATLIFMGEKYHVECD